jgi:ribose transport system substrate-binding protein
LAKTSTTFDRRNRLLTLLHERPGIRVSEIAQVFKVAEGTVRNDLIALARDKRLERVRGGGIPTDNHPIFSPAFKARLNVQDAEKLHIARWAAELIEDGDTILLDASSTVFRMAPFINNHRRLTIVTNGIEVGLTLARNPENSVLLLGGKLNSDGIPVTNLVSDQFLKDLHIKTAFVSCSGFTPEAGLTERDILEAQIKTEMIAAADSLVALIDSSKFGKQALVPLARTEEIARIFTDSGLDHRWIEQLRATCTILTVCNEDGVVDYTPCARETRHYRIGFANLGETMPFSIDVRRGVERAAQAAGNIDVVFADNRLDREVALAVAERFTSQNLDLVIEYQIDEQTGNQIMDKFRQAGIPVIAVDIPIVGATFFGVNNYRAGHMAGLALGNWIKENWAGYIDWLIVLEEPRAGSLVAARIQGQLDRLQSVIGGIPADRRLTLNSGNTCEISETEMTAALRQMPDVHKIAVICFNDDAALGALKAAQKLHREQDVVIVGQGADRRVRNEMRHPGCRIIGSTAYEPEKYGEKLIPLALKILRGEPVPPAVYIDHEFIPASQERTPMVEPNPKVESAHEF